MAGIVRLHVHGLLRPVPESRALDYRTTLRRMGANNLAQMSGPAIIKSSRVGFTRKKFLRAPVRLVGHERYPALKPGPGRFGKVVHSCGCNIDAN